MIIDLETYFTYNLGIDGLSIPLQPSLALAVARIPPRLNSPSPGRSSKLPDPLRFILPKIFLMPLFLLICSEGDGCGERLLGMDPSLESSITIFSASAMVNT